MKIVSINGMSPKAIDNFINVYKSRGLIVNYQGYSEKHNGFILEFKRGMY